MSNWRRMDVEPYQTIEKTRPEASKGIGNYDCWAAESQGYGEVETKLGIGRRAFTSFHVLVTHPDLLIFGGTLLLQPERLTTIESPLNDL